MRRFNIIEWKHLDIGDVLSDNDKTITRGEADRLISFTEKLRSNKQVSGSVFRLSPSKLKAKGIVGIVQIKNCSVEILPKIESRSGIEIEEDTVRERLVDMIALTHNLKVDVGNQTNLKNQNKSLLEILIGIFVNKLSDAVRVGLTRKYINQEEDLPTLQGTLNLPRQFTIHAANPSRLACRYDLFSIDIPLNQVIKATVGHLEHLSHSMRNRQLLRELSMIFANVSDVPVNKIRWDLITINRSNNRWKEIYSMAQLFLKRQYQTTTTGSSEGFALLFDMNKLFEEYIGRQIQKEVAKLPSTQSNCDYEVSLQRGNEYCLKDLHSQDPKFRTQPDITIRFGSEIVHIIDTKWKLVNQKETEGWNGVSQADVYQMMVYGELYKTPKLTLLYPCRLELNEGLHKIGEINENRHLTVFTIDVSNKETEKEHIHTLLKQCIETKKG